MFSNVQTSLEMAIKAEDAGLIQVFDFRSNMDLYRSHPAENVWDTFFSQEHDASSLPASTQTFSFPRGKRIRDRDALARAAKKHLRVQPALIEQHAKKLQESGIEPGYHAIFYRGTDKASESQPVTMSDYDDAIRAHPRTVIQTDDQRFLDHALRIRSDVRWLDQPYSQDGRPLHKDDRISPYDRGVVAINAFLTLVGADKITTNASNLSNCARFLRNDQATVIGHERI